MKHKVRISKLMSYLLRHNPMGVSVSRDGFLEVEDFLNLIQKQYPLMDRGSIEKIVEEDEKGRYELKANRIRARYGHTINVVIGFPLADTEILYHGTSKHVAREILSDGLKPMKRKKVHLSKTIEDALRVGMRRTANPVILKIDVRKAAQEGIRIERATDSVYISDTIPKEFLSVCRGKV